MFKKTGLPLAGGEHLSKQTKRPLIGAARGFTDPAPPRHEKPVESTARANFEAAPEPLPEDPIPDEQLSREEPAPTESAPSPTQHLEPLSSSDQALPRAVICFSHRDRSFVERLIVHLTPLRKLMSVHFLEVGQMVHGDARHMQVEAELKDANAILALTSADFLAGGLILDDDDHAVFRSAQANGARLIVVYASPCLIEDFELADFLAINSPETTLRDFQSEQYSARQERIYMNAVMALKNAVQGFA